MGGVKYRRNRKQLILTSDITANQMPGLHDRTGVNHEAAEFKPAFPVPIQVRHSSRVRHLPAYLADYMQ